MAAMHVSFVWKRNNFGKRVAEANYAPAAALVETTTLSDRAKMRLITCFLCGGAFCRWEEGSTELDRDMGGARTSEGTSYDA